MTQEKTYKSIQEDFDYQLEYLKASESLENMKEKCIHHLKRSVLFMNMVVANSQIINSDDKLINLGEEIIEFHNKVQTQLESIFIEPLENRCVQSDDIYEENYTTEVEQTSLL